MSNLSTMPAEVNIEHYAQDTLVIHIKIDDEVIAGRVFNAHVRSQRTSRKVDAEFDVFLTATGADLVLTAEASAPLTKRGVYDGFWDVQLSDAGEDPITTLGQGSLTLNPDVTRVSTNG